MPLLPHQVELGISQDRHLLQGKPFAALRVQQDEVDKTMSLDGQLLLSLEFPRYQQ